MSTSSSRSATKSKTRVSRRVAVTGVGLVSPCGGSAESTWQALLAGESGIRRVSSIDVSQMRTQIAGEALGFDARAYIDAKEIRRMDRYEHLAIAAAEMAVKHANLTVAPEEGHRAAVIVGSGIGGILSLEEAVHTIRDRGPGKVGPYLILQISMNLAPGFISIRHGMRGPSFSTSSACATGAHAIGEAMRGIERGDYDIAIAGAAEAPVSPVALSGFAAMRAMSTRNDEPARASRPFDKDRDGFVLAEGAGMLVLEAWDHAVARGARILAEMAGYAATSDAYHPTTPAPRHAEGERCMRLALEDAELGPDSVAYVNAHATSTEVGDLLECEAIANLFGADANKLLVSSTKSATGHMLGAAGAAEAVISVMSLVHGVAPPTLNLENQDPRIPLNCVPLKPQAFAKAGEAVLSNAFGFGGTNVALVFRRAP
jgi:3-oxoacyl-[acyl-carrier-protein] synthase II